MDNVIRGEGVDQKQNIRISAVLSHDDDDCTQNLDTTFYSTVKDGTQAPQTVSPISENLEHVIKEQWLSRKVAHLQSWT